MENQNRRPEDEQTIRSLRNSLNRHNFQEFENTLRPLSSEQGYNILMSQDDFGSSLFQDTYRNNETQRFFHASLTKMPENRRVEALLTNYRYRPRPIDEIATHSMRLHIAVNSAPANERVALLTNENAQGETPIALASAEANSLRTIRGGLDDNQMKEVLRHRNSQGQTACDANNGTWSTNVQLSVLAGDAIADAVSKSKTDNISKMAAPMKKFIDRIGKGDPDTLGDILIDHNRRPGTAQRGPETAQSFVDRLNETHQGRDI